MDKKRKNVRKEEDIEDATKYGEFISSFDNWITMDKQKRRVNHIEKITNNGKEDK